MKQICITNRHLTKMDLLEKLEEILENSDIDILILREKDMEESEYTELARKALALCNAKGVLCILHSFIGAAKKLHYPHIHLSYHAFLGLTDEERTFFKTIGVSTHSIEEAVQCEKLNASYITASHIFETKCKEGLDPRGLNFLKNVCEAVRIPVYALGGINRSNMHLCMENGADGVCMMSGYMYDHAENEKTEDFERYQRQMLLNGFGKEGQKKLACAKVLVVGAGGLGSPVIMYLAGAGIGTLGIADADQVSLSNIHRQVIHPMKNIGKNKALSAKEFVNALNEQIRVIVYPYFITKDNVRNIVSEYDFVIDCVDNFETEFLLNDACVLLKKPFCYGGVIQDHGQVMTYVPQKGPCYRCIYEEEPEPDSIPTSSEVGIIGPAAGAIGCIQAMEAIKYFTGTGDLLTGRMYIFDLKTMKTRMVKFPKANENCSACGPKAHINL